MNDDSNANNGNANSNNNNEEVPGTQFSQEEAHYEEPATPIPSRERIIAGTPAQRIIGSRSVIGGGGLDHVPATPGVNLPRGIIAATPARRSAAEPMMDDEEDIVPSLRGGDRSSARSIRSAASDSMPSMRSGSLSRRMLGGNAGGNAGAGGEGDGGEEDDEDDFDGLGGIGIALGGHESEEDDNEHNPDDPQQQQQQPHEEEQEDATTLIRGTDVHVQTAAAAFRDFIRNFVSVEESERMLAREAKALRKKRKRARAGGAGGGGGGDGDDGDDGDGNHGDGENSWLPSDSEEDNDEEEQNNEEDTPKTPIYLQKLEQILLRGHSNSTPDSLTSSAANAGTGRIGVASLDLDALHLYFHSPSCQRLYGWLADYPAEIVPLMDILLGRELESLRDTLRLQQEERLADAEARGDELEMESATGILELLPEVLPRVQVRPFHLRQLSHMRSLDPNAIDTLLSIRGMVVRTSPVIPDLKVAFFQCSICGQTEQITIDRGRIAEPTQCPTCHVRHGYSLIHNRCYFSDKQMVRVQETPDEVPAGETPASIVVFAYDDLVDAVRPGDRVEVTGVFRAQARRVNPKITKVKSVYRTYVDAIHFRKVMAQGSREGTMDAPSSSNFVNTKDRKEEDADGDDDENGDGKENQQQQQQLGKGVGTDEVIHSSRFSPERIADLEALSRTPDVYDRLVQALAPSIWEMDDVKKGVLAMLFGGNSRKVKKGTAGRRKNREKARQELRELRERGEDMDVEDHPELEEEDEEEDELKLNKRGDINILLVGDPGTSKSQLLGYVHKLSPRGVYTSGKGSSAVGLTASVVRDPETRELVMESGALVLSDLGICCIDEFDKMSGTTRAILHEAMEQQTVSIAKAGIIATLNARTSILASANPVESRYNPSLSVVENIQLPPTLLSRFDLIYLILDSPNTDNDRMLAQHLVGLYYETPNVVEPPLDHGLLRDYIAYARENIHPELSDLASRELIAAYLDMRKMGSGGSGGRGRTISATPRQLESLIRISESLARMRYSRVVSRSDVREAVRLMKVATQSAATDPRTGKIDMDMITTGRSTAERELEESLGASLKELLVERRGNRMGVSDIKRQLSEIINANVQQDDLVECLRLMEADGLVQFNERAQTVFVRAGVVG